LFCETLSQKNPSQKRAGGVAQDAGPEFKPQYHKQQQQQQQQNREVKGQRATSTSIFCATSIFLSVDYLVLKQSYLKLRGEEHRLKLRALSLG
jgi:hypothetical protein